MRTKERGGGVQLPKKRKLARCVRLQARILQKRANNKWGVPMFWTYSLNRFLKFLGVCLKYPKPLLIRLVYKMDGNEVDNVMDFENYKNAERWVKTYVADARGLFKEGVIESF